MVWPLLPRDATPVLRGPRVLLRGPRARDFAAWRNLRRDSRDFLKPFEPRWSEADLTHRVFTVCAAGVRRRQTAPTSTS